ncbi:Holliday junction resolvase RuvX [Jatrophihabitans sp. YIM 134969]
MAVWLGVDVGTVRIGVAKSDATGLLASPLTAVRRDRRGGTDVAALVALAAEWEAEGFVVGLPVTLRGTEGASVGMAREFAAALTAAAPDLTVRFTDERNTTVTAQQHLRAIGIPARRQKDLIDARAAAVLLQAWLDRERAATSSGEVTA